MEVRVSKSAFNQHLFLQQYNCQQGLNSLAPEQNEDPVNLKSNLISHRKSLFFFFIFLSLCSLSLPKEGGFPSLRAALGLLKMGFSQPDGLGRGGGPEKVQHCLGSSGCKSPGMGRDTRAQRGHTPCPSLGSWQAPECSNPHLCPAPGPSVMSQEFVGPVGHS